MAGRYRKVHLLTFAASYEALTLFTIRSSPQNARTNLSHLQRHFGADKFVHTIVGCEAVRDRIFFDVYRRIFVRNDYLRVSLCPACTVAMHLLTMDYCRQRSIRYVSDGSSGESGRFQWQMQHPDNLAVVISKYAAAGITYLINPCYGEADSAETLFSAGILPERVDKSSFRYRRTTQQFCIPIQLQSLCRNIHGGDIPPDAGRVAEFIETAW
jgi:hypothetical protein